MSKIYMYAHGGSGNHGCEAIVRSTVGMLKDKLNKEMVLISAKPQEDKKYGIDKLCNILLDKEPYSKNSLAFLKAYLTLKLTKDYIPMDKMEYKTTFDNIDNGDIALSIGGDNYCYKNVAVYGMMHDMLLKRGARTVLWGCSVEPKLTKDEKIAKDLARYSLICARESISYEALKKVNPNTVLVSDPAFLLNAKECALPEGFKVNNTLGLNLSPMAMDLETSKGIALENYKNLISYIIENTDMQVALIPHVIWAGGDDREPLEKLYDMFKDTGRVVLVEDHSCEEQKYIISKCRFFIGARTHATIAAYSTCVPTLVLGYSIKSRGIARDIFGSEDNYVLPVQNLENSHMLTNAFKWIMGREDEIKKHLVDFMPSYKEKADASKYILELK